MNSLNILSSRVIGQTPSHTQSTSSTPRSRSLSEGSIRNGLRDPQPRRSASGHEFASSLATDGEKDVWPAEQDSNEQNIPTPSDISDEKTPLLGDAKPISSPVVKQSRLRLVAKRLVDALTASLKWVLSTLTTPGVYLVTCFYDEAGNFSPVLPVRKLRQTMPKRNGNKSTAHAIGLSGSAGGPERTTAPKAERRAGRRRLGAANQRVSEYMDSVSSATSESEVESVESEKLQALESGPQPKSQVPPPSENAPTRRSIRIKLYSEDTARRAKGGKVQRNTSSAPDAPKFTEAGQPAITVATLKSPTSPASSLRMTKYPRAPAPPRPLIPRRQPSYSIHTPSRRSSTLAQKTLVIDLDETLIHSLAKGGRMSSGHMVEVKLNTAIGFGGTTLGPRHPILYYVHKRPHCDDFLRKVCKWYNLVVFTASVQEYADPVIDWLEQERKYFSARYYRQHCTFRNGAYIKDLSSVEPDLSKVMILDNSPLSYIFHEGELSIRFWCWLYQN